MENRIIAKLEVLLDFHLEGVLGRPADGADPIIRYLLEGCAWGNARGRVPLGRVVDVTADCALVFVHG